LLALLPDLLCAQGLHAALVGLLANTFIRRHGGAA
jgi:hypothetical protein